MERERGARREILRGNFLLLVMSSFLFSMASHVIVPMFPLYLSSMGALEAEVGFIVGLSPLAAVMVSIPVGRFIDRHSRRSMLLAGIAFQAVVPFLYILCTDTEHFVVVRLLGGVGLAAFVITAQTMVVDIAPKGRMGEVLGIFSIAHLTASAAGPSFSGLLLSGFGFASTFYVAGAFGLAATAIALCIKVPRRQPSTETGGGFREVLRNRNLLTASLAMAVVVLPAGVTHSFFPLYAHNSGVSPEGVGLYFTVFALCMGGVRPFVGALSDRVGRVVVSIPFMVLTALGIWIFVIVGDLPGFLISGGLLGLGIGGAYSSLSALSVDTVQPRLRGQAVAVNRATNDLGVSVGAMGMGPVAMFGGFSLAFGATAAIVLGGTAAFLGIRAFWRKEEKVYT